MHVHRSKRNLIIGIALFAAAWLAILLILYFGMQLLEEPEKPTYGSLEGRFVSQIQYENENGRFAYRENQLTTVLLIGVDRENLGAVTGYRSGGQADFLMLLVLDNHNKTVTPVQIDRDTVTPIKMFGAFGQYSGVRVAQLALAQNFGQTPLENCENTAWAVSNLLCGIPVDEYIAVDMSAIPVINDFIGGVTVTLEDDLTLIDASFTKGATVKLEGSLAENFVRARMGVSDGRNTSRMRRQRTYMTALKDTAIEKVKNDPDFGGKLFDTLGSSMVTGLTRPRLEDFFLKLAALEVKDIVVPAGTYNINSSGYNEFHPDEKALTEMILGLCFETIKR